MASHPNHKRKRESSILRSQTQESSRIKHEHVKINQTRNETVTSEMKLGRLLAFNHQLPYVFIIKQGFGIAGYLNKINFSYERGEKITITDAPTSLKEKILFFIESFTNAQALPVCPDDSISLTRGRIHHVLLHWRAGRGGDAHLGEHGLPGVLPGRRLIYVTETKQPLC